jgi:hypothetical protein
MYMSFKIMPVIDNLRNRDMFILEHHDRPIPSD